MGNNLVIYFLFIFPVCEGFWVLDWKRNWFSRFAMLVVYILDFNYGE